MVYIGAQIHTHAHTLTYFYIRITLLEEEKKKICAAQRKEIRNEYKERRRSLSKRPEEVIRRRDNNTKEQTHVWFGPRKILTKKYIYLFIRNKKTPFTVLGV